MPLLLRGLLESDGVTPIQSSTTYVIAGSGAPEFFRLPGMPWNTLLIRANEVPIPDRDFANILSQPPRSQLAELVELGLVSVSQNGASGNFAFAAGTVTLTNTEVVFLPDMVGQTISIVGATSPANDGLFTVASYIGPTQITYANPLGVTEAGAGEWSVPLTADQVRDYA